MARQKKVVDASIAVKWFSHEPGSKEALQLLEDHKNQLNTLVIPEFAFLEILNALRFKHMDAALLHKINKDLWDLRLFLEPLTPSLLEMAISIAIEYDLTVYDALYAAVCHVHHCPLETDDKRLSKAVNFLHAGIH